MSDHFNIDNNTRTSTIGGTMTAIFMNILQNDIIRTIGFAASPPSHFRLGRLEMGH